MEEGGRTGEVAIVANVQSEERLARPSTPRQRAERAGDEARGGEAERWERYRSNIAAAAAALQLQNSGTARRALEAAPPEHRDWEWRHLHSQLDGARAVMPGHAALGIIAQLPIISPSGEQLATVDNDERTINLWDIDDRHGRRRPARA